MKMELRKYTKYMFDAYLDRLNRLKKGEKCWDPYEGLRIARIDFKPPYLQCADYEMILLVVLQLLMKHVYNTTEFESGQFTIGYVMKIPSGEVTYTIGKAVPLNGNAAPNLEVCAQILKLLIKKAEDYDKALLSGVFIRVYLRGMQGTKKVPLSKDEMNAIILQLMNADIENANIENADIDGSPEVQAMGKKSRYPNHIPALKPTTKVRRPFIVADTETVLINNVHVPYAAGFIALRPGEDIGVYSDSDFKTYFSEDDLFRIPEFIDRSNRMLFGFLELLAVHANRTNIRTVYFHNFSRFDGILLMKYYASRADKGYTFKPLLRNLKLYELAVYRDRKLVFRLRDSYTLLPSSLAKLAKTLCPQLGSKGSIPHDEVRVANLMDLREQLLEYMIQDIRLLGGVMLKAQDIYWTKYKVDIEDCLTLSSLAMTIYRSNYYDSISWPIHIPSRNEDTFIRRGYYGGHADTYKPYGENLYYYDVNSLYPYIMKSCPMPGGVPVWHANLEGQELSNLYGFIEAYVVCPNTITRPFLPYRDHNDTLLFPTGKFVGVYFSEELIYARDLGYKIFPMRGYLFEKKPSPFDSFVTSLFASRQEAKLSGDEAMAYSYKILMNSLYGRFGINPKSTITEVCNRNRYDYLTQRDNLIFGDKLSEQYYIVSYVGNAGNVEDKDWNPPKISAVQLAAAITAQSRIHMYKYISRPDCYYTDTDSAILGSPLPEDEISPIELGKLKLEHFVKRGIFLAPKSYTIVTEEAGDIIKHKGPAKDLVNVDWFESQYADLSRTKQLTVESHFRIDWHTLDIAKKAYQVTLGIKLGSKREPVYDHNHVWVDTLPKDVTDFGGQESQTLKFELMILRELLEKKEREYAQMLEKKDEYAQMLEKKDEYAASLESEVAKLREEIQLRSAKPPTLHKHPTAVKRPLTKPPTGLEQPTLYMQPKPKGKGKGKEPKGKGKKPKGKKPP